MIIICESWFPLIPAERTITGKICFISGLLFGKLASGSVIYVISWSSRNSRRPVESVASAKILATGDAIDEGKALVKALNELFNMKIELCIALDSKDLFTTPLTCRLASDRSNLGDENSIRFEFATKMVSVMIYVLGNSNLADSGTKANSPLTQTLQLIQVSGIIPIDFADAIILFSEKFRLISFKEIGGMLIVNMTSRVMVTFKCADVIFAKSRLIST